MEFNWMNLLMAYALIGVVWASLRTYGAVYWLKTGDPSRCVFDAEAWAYPDKMEKGMRGMEEIESMLSQVPPAVASLSLTLAFGFMFAFAVVRWPISVSQIVWAKIRYTFR